MKKFIMELCRYYYLVLSVSFASWFQLASSGTIRPVQHENKTSQLYNKFSCVNKKIGENCMLTKMLTHILGRYDKRVRPDMHTGRSVVVTVGIWILSIDAVNVIDMDYRVDLFLRQSWIDPRLANAYHKPLTISNTVLNQIWIPDTYIQNSKKSDFHSITVPNIRFALYPNGTIMYLSRISVQASCPMDLRWFPVDRQECNLHIESYGFTTRDIRYKWENGKDKVALADGVKQLSQYNVTSVDTETIETPYVTGNWSSLKVIFSLRRQYEYFFLNLYAPCAMIVMLSWINFFIPNKAVAARIGLSITAVLVVVTVMNVQNKVLPKVSYIKLADWYLIWSFVFVTAVFVEYTTVLYLAKKREEKAEAKKQSEIQNEEETVCQVQSPFKRSAAYRMRDEPENTTTEVLKRTPSSPKNSNDHSRKPLLKKITSIGESQTKPDDNPSWLKKTKQSKENKYGLLNYISIFDYKCHSLQPEVIDEYSRIFFPLAFASFNTIYWWIFFSNKN